MFASLLVTYKSNAVTKAPPDILTSKDCANGSDHIEQLWPCPEPPPEITPETGSRVKTVGVDTGECGPGKRVHTVGGGTVLLVKSL